MNETNETKEMNETNEKNEIKSNTSNHTMKTNTIEETIRDIGINQYGKWLIELRRGEDPKLRPDNPFLFEAVKLKGQLYTLPELREEFPNIFENPTLPILLEIGCYLGHNISEFAKYNPRFNVLGLDIKYKRVVRSCQKIQKEKLTNAKVALCDIQDLITILPEKSIYGMFIFFPDPWVKSRHEKFRFLIEEFFQTAFSRLVPGGIIWLKTDHKDYYEAAAEYAQQYNYRIIDKLPPALAQREYKTIFEGIFQEQKLPVYRLLLTPMQEA